MSPSQGKCKKKHLRKEARSQRLRADEKLEIIRSLESVNRPKKTELARKYGVSESAIRQTWANRERYKQHIELMNPTARENTFQIVDAKYGELEASLMYWIRVLREAKRPVTPGLVRIRALNCAKLMGLDEFKASSQWMLNFRTRFGLKFEIMHGEAGEVDKNDPLLLSVFTTWTKREDVGTARGEKKSKDRVSSWKQPCDMGIIASLKKRYKYLYLSKILSFYDMPPEEQALTNRIASTRRRGTAGVDMGRPATLLDAANYVVTAWNDLAPSCIANCFRKTELFNVHTQEDDIDDDVISDMVDLLAASNIETTHAEIEAFIHNDDDDSDMMNDSILIELEKIDNGMSSLVINSQDDSDEEETKEDPYRAPLPSDAFARACNSVVDVVDELYTFDCDDMAQAYMDELRPMFEAVIFKLRQVNADHNGSRMRRRKQMTLFDVGFNPKS
ncbi:unnamed protein product [Aphanomyces euteiches]